MYYTYVLYSKTFHRLYVGQTSNLSTRLEEHNSGKTKSTKHYIPWELICSLTSLNFHVTVLMYFFIGILL
jgi:predicted GIY-YIG superfamily endonuclease